MGILLVKTAFKTTKVQLKNHNILGRHSSSDVYLGKNAGIPLFWLEIRWIENQWCWRALNQIDQTIGSGTIVQNDWRSFKKTLRFQQIIHLELLDSSEPEILIEDVISKEKFPLSNFPAVSEEDGYIRFNGKPLLHEEHFYFNQRLYQLWLVEQSNDTESQIFDLCSPHCFLDIDIDNLEASFTLEKLSITVSGECARILWVYAKAKKEGANWLSTEEAFTDWVLIGGNPKSDPERLSWERSRLRRILSEQKADNASKLFTRRKNGYEWQHSLVIPASNIQII